MRPAIARGLCRLVLATLLTLPLAAAGQAQGTYETAKLEAFVEAFVEVDAVVGRWMPKLQAASDDEALDMQKRARAEMIQAIEDTAGITPMEYGDIVKAMESDPDLSQRVADIYRERSGN